MLISSYNNGPQKTALCFGCTLLRVCSQNGAKQNSVVTSREEVLTTRNTTLLSLELNLREILE